jgi:hypothetical protein
MDLMTDRQLWDRLRRLAETRGVDLDTPGGLADVAWYATRAGIPLAREEWRLRLQGRARGRAPTLATAVLLSRALGFSLDALSGPETLNASTDLTRHIGDKSRDTRCPTLKAPENPMDAVNREERVPEERVPRGTRSARRTRDTT